MTPNLTPEEVIRRLYGGGKPLLFVVLAVQIASCASELPKVMRQLLGRERLRIPHLAQLPIEDWVGLYSDSRRLKNAAGSFIVAEELPAAEIMQNWREFAHKPKDIIRQAVSEEIEADPHAFDEVVAMFTGVHFPPEIDVLKVLLEAIS